MSKIQRKAKLRSLILLGCSLIFLMIGLLIEQRNMDRSLTFRRIEWTKKTLREKESALDAKFDQISNILKVQKEKSPNYFLLLEKYNDILSSEGLALLVFHKDTLKYWSDNEVSFVVGNVQYQHEDGLIHLPTGWYLEYNRHMGPYVISGFIQLKQEYSYENKFLKHQFRKEFKLPSDYEIFERRVATSWAIYDQNGKFAFALLPKENPINRVTDYYLPSIFYLLALILFLISLGSSMRTFRKAGPLIRMGAISAILSGIYALLIYGRWPHAFQGLDMFTPQYFAWSSFLPSLGAFLLLALLLFVWAMNFFREFKFFDWKRSPTIFFIFSQLFNLIFLAGVIFLLEILFANSSISFALQNVIQLSEYSYFSYGAIILLFSASLVVSIRISRLSFRKLTNRQINVSLLSLAVLAFIGAYLLGITLPVAFAAYFLLLNFILIKTSKERFKKYRLTYTVVFPFVASLYFLFYYQSCLIKHDRGVQQLLAENLASERDPTAEILLAEVDKNIKEDEDLQDLIAKEDYQVANYLAENYFDGYFRRYDMQFPICSEGDSVLIKPEYIQHSCYPYFDELIRTKGVRIPGTNFYLLERMNGRICYFGRFFFKDIPPRGRTLYVELNSRILSEGIGFPELLLDEKVTRSKNLERFSSAKFYDGKLVDRRGKFQYILSPKVYLDKAGSSNFFEMNNYEHYLYRLKGSNIIVVSRPKVQAIDYLVSFPYIFVFFFLFSLGLSFFNVRRRKSPPGLKQKIQIALVSTMLVSLVFVAIGTIFYNVRDYRVRRQDDLGDKLQSVLSVLETQVTGLDSINGSYLQMLRETELFRLSEIFSTDINLYDLDGNLLASSRPEIFRKGLLSRKMSAEAYSELAYKDQMRYIQPEKIGGLEYMSAYIPLLNDREQPLAYINLPYFVKEDKMKQEVSTFVVAFINIYVFMILASILIAVVISNQVTRPLVLVRDKLRTIQLGKKNEPISYEGNDEIGSIVKEYNRKVEELAVSADRLAQSERESAWREMARQIAHEIKNPLTPMKLNIQYLQRAKKEQLPDYDAYFNRVTKTLIEQIDTLSSIASSFSNFAKIPKPHMESVSLEERVNEVLGLFENTASVEFLFLNKAQSDDHVYVDREQITRVLINLVKNAIQAIPKNRKGKVEVTIKRNDDRVILEVMDNGPGVPEELREKLFRPNFTTKSSGMGLGLAISKSIIENFNGKIGFITSQNQGTTFFIDLPSFDSFRDENKISHA